jgi:hypothetical protein
MASGARTRERSEVIHVEILAEMEVGGYPVTGHCYDFVFRFDIRESIALVFHLSHEGHEV